MFVKHNEILFNSIIFWGVRGRKINHGQRGPARTNDGGFPPLAAFFVIASRLGGEAIQIA
jgi:hypothetical protein